MSSLLRRWVAQAGIAEVNGAPEGARPSSEVVSDAPISGFVPVRIEPPLSKTTIDVEVRRGATVGKVCWPMAAVSDCGAWLRELLP